MTTFNSTGVNAATANLPCTFSTLPASAVNETNSTYGNVNRSMSTARPNCPSCADEARCKREDQERRRHDADGRDHEQADAERARDVTHELARLRVAAVRPILRDHGNERLRERAFGKEPAQQVRNLERDGERVHDEPGAEPSRERDIAREARDARQQRHARRRPKWPASRRSLWAARVAPRRRSSSWADHGAGGYVLDLPKVAPNNSRLFPGLGPKRKLPLANIQSAKKRARQAIKRRAHNVALRSRVRTAIRKVMKAVEAGDKDSREGALRRGRAGDRPDGHQGHPAQEPRRSLQEPAQRQATRHALTARPSHRACAALPSTTSRPARGASCRRPSTR